MRSVSASLEPLSSPSPSPSPPPPETTERAGSQPTTAGGVGLDSGSELSELTEEEQDTENRSNGDGNDEELDEDEEEEQAGGTRRQPARRGGGRRKRGGMVPAPMWDWAYKQKKSVERGATAPEEEEEEEEQPSPPKAMEEEEDEEDGSRHTSRHPSINGNAGEDEDEKDEEDEPWGVDHDSEHGKKTRRLHIFPQDSAARHVALQAALLADSEDCDEEEYDEDEDEEPDVEEDGDVPQLDLDPADPANDSDSEPDLAPPTGSTTIPATVGPMDVDIDGNVDITVPSPAVAAPMVAAASARSIMAGSSILASATPSPNSSLSGSPTSSRSASPAQEKADEEDEDEEDDGEGATHGHKRGGKKQLLRDDEDPDPLASAAFTVDGVKSKLSVKDAETEDLEVASVIHDDLDLEIDADLQPAHRAEALDVLATIELKFSLLRERVYVEKMEGLAWEEALVAEGTHPEFVYLQTELSRREAKRKELAARQRTYDISLVTKKRKMDEDYTWGWWKFARDELQTDMVSEHKRKYRRLERDRRALGQPQPVRHIPSVPRDVPPPPTLRQIVKKTFPYPGNRLSSKKRDHTSANTIPFVYPELSTLSSADIATDLEYLYQNRRAPFDPHSHRMGMSMSVSGPQLGPANPAMTPMQHGAYDAYVMNVDSGGIPQYTSGSRMPPPGPPQYQQHQQQPGHQVLQPFPSASGRSQLHSSHPQTPSSSSLHNHTQGQFTVEQEMTLVPVHQYFSGPAPGASLGISRPISPVHVVGGGPGMAGPGGKQGGWAGDGRMPGSHQSGGKQVPEYGWMGMREAMEDSRDRDSKRDREREREKRERSDRERDREFEREPEYTMQQQAPQPHRHAPPHQHSHLHNSPAQSSHLHQGPHHHHRHHHHVVHHHHPQQSGNSSGQHVPQGSSGPGSVLSPRVATARDFEPSRAHSGPVHPPEVLSLSASKPGNPSSHWKRDELSSSEYREIRGRHGSRPSSAHPAPGVFEDRERPLATPFAMASSQAMSSAGASGLPNGQSATSAHSPRLPWSDEHGSRMPPSSSSFPGPLGRGSPLGMSPPRNRPPAPRSPSSSLAFPGSIRSPTRYAPSGPVVPPLADPPVMHSLSSAHGRSASTPESPGLKARGLSPPPPGKMGMGYSPQLSGPGRTSTPTSVGPPVDIHSSTHSAPAQNTSAFNRTASPLMSFNSPSSHSSHPPASSRPPANGNATLLPAPKTNAVQMVDVP